MGVADRIDVDGAIVRGQGVPPQHRQDQRRDHAIDRVCDVEHVHERAREVACAEERDGAACPSAVQEPPQPATAIEKPFAECGGALTLASRDRRLGAHHAVVAIGA